MSNKNTIIIDGKEFVIDYIKGEIYREIALIPKGTPGYFPMKGEEFYPFRKIKNELYFQMGKKFYKILNNKDVFEITKEEYNENNKYIIINRNINDSNVVNHYKNYVMANIINKIMQEKYNKRKLIPISMNFIISHFITRLNPATNQEVDNLTIQIISELPIWIKRDEVKKLIKEVYDKVLQENEEGMRLLLDNIYESNKDNFDALYNRVLESGQQTKEKIKKIKGEKHKVLLTLPAG